MEMHMVADMEVDKVADNLLMKWSYQYDIRGRKQSSAVVILSDRRYTRDLSLKKKLNSHRAMRWVYFLLENVQ